MDVPFRALMNKIDDNLALKASQIYEEGLNHPNKCSLTLLHLIPQPLSTSQLFMSVSQSLQSLHNQ